RSPGTTDPPSPAILNPVSPGSASPGLTGAGLTGAGLAGPGLAGADAASAEAALATSLMDLYRRTGDADVFDCLVKWVGPQLQMRIRSRLRGMGAMFDAQEILQDTIVNIYRYPDRFLATRAGAFAAWSSTIVD